MASNRTFHLVNARHAVSDDDVHVDFVNANELVYGRSERHVTLAAERYIASDGAPDGRVVTLVPGLSWSDGTAVTEVDVAAIREDLLAAAGPLQSKMRFSAA